MTAEPSRLRGGAWLPLPLLLHLCPSLPVTAPGQGRVAPEHCRALPSAQAMPALVRGITNVTLTLGLHLSL